MSSATPFVDKSGDIPTVVPRYNHGRCYGSSVDGGTCESMDLSFESIEEWEEHRRKYHPTSCSNWSCDYIASYKRLGGPSAYCIEHMPAAEAVEGGYRWRRANTESVVEPPRLPDEHPVELALSGLEADD